MSKYEDAFRDYAFFRCEIKRLTKKIGECLIEWKTAKHDWHHDGEYEYSVERCEKLEIGQNCLSRSWERNKKQRYNDEEFCESPELLPKITLCPSCQAAQKFIDQRKEAKQKFAIQKRRVLALGKGLLKAEGYDV
jgi:hypothetical protein